MNYYEPPPLEIKLTLGLGLTLLRPYYWHFANSLALQGDEQVLDFGSGSGVCSRHIAARLDKGGQLHCVDISRKWQIVIRRMLRRYGNMRFYCGRISQLDLPDHHFDLVVSHFVLHDLPSDERVDVLKTLAAKLKPGGRLVFREPEEARFNLRAAAALAKQAGLRVRQIEYHWLLWNKVVDGCLEVKNQQEMKWSK